MLHDKKILKISWIALSVGCFVMAVIWLFGFGYAYEWVQASQHQRMANSIGFVVDTELSGDAMNAFHDLSQERMQDYFDAAEVLDFDLSRHANDVVSSRWTRFGTIADDIVWLITFHNNFSLIGAAVVIGADPFWDPNGGHVISLNDAQALDIIALDEQ